MYSNYIEIVSTANHTPLRYVCVEHHNAVSLHYKLSYSYITVGVGYLCYYRVQGEAEDEC